jgi:hypothetical protein
MAGQPTEAMLGIGALGLGTVLVISAFKNVSPVALIKAAVTTGDLDLSKLPKIDSGPSGDGSANKIPPAAPKAVLDKIRAKDDAMANQIQHFINTANKNTPTSETNKMADLLDQAEKAGYISSFEKGTLGIYLKSLVGMQ